MIGQTISHYKILSKLGEGGMGVVYKAEDTKLKRTVALKSLPYGVTASEEEILRIQHEAEAISALNHPHIATIYDVDEIDGQKFLVLEYIPGDTLKSKLNILISEDKQLPLNAVVEYGIQIAEGLAHAHRHRIIHRDVKLDNVMLTEEGKVKLTDFGLAKFEGATRVTKTGSTVGTAAYMSPEQIRGEDVDYRSDIFSLGVVLYELTTSHLPFRELHEAALTYAIVNEQHPAVKSLREDVPLAFEKVIDKCLEKNKANRYQNTEDIVIALKEVAQEVSGPIRMVIQKSRLPWVVAVAIVVSMIGSIYFYMTLSHPDSTSNKTIAVLPFANLNDDKADEYFTDGITDDILAQLYKIADLNVISRTTMMQYKNSKKSLREIGKDLNAGVVLEGSVRRAGNRVRIVSQLIDASNDKHIWAETYDRELKNVFEIQSEIAQMIAASLHAKLSSAEKEQIEKQSHYNIEVYNLLLQGRFYTDRRDRESIAKAVGLFKQALSIDPKDARVWAALAYDYLIQADNGFLSTDEGYAKARQAAEKAISLDNNLALGHIVMAWIKRSYDWDWNGTENEYRKAFALEPGDASTIINMASLAGTLGRFDQAITLSRKSISLNPVFVLAYVNLGFQLSKANRLEEAATVLRKALEMNPGCPSAHTQLGRIYLLQGKLDSAIVEVQKESLEFLRMYGLALVYHHHGRKADADAALNNYIVKYQNGGAFQIAEIYAYHGEADLAFEWLERAYSQRDGGLADIKGDPFLKKIENDPRYVELLRKMKLPI